MKKNSALWSVNDLLRDFVRINFPEYQREPNVWSRPAKQRLIDSIVREFDIASIYLYEDQDGGLDCIDGRQRLGAIMAFTGENPEDEDNGFEYKRMNEIFVDDEGPYEDLEGLTFAEIKERGGESDPSATAFLDAFLRYQFTVVRLAGSRKPEEFNLQFTRLNLGTIINSGEKLHAMVGDLRDVCFKDLGLHDFLEATRIPTRRYAREQVAAQILGQVFSLANGNGYARTRHFDLQRLFKEHTSLGEDERNWVRRVREIMDLLEVAFADVGILKNRALTVSTVLLGWELEISKKSDATAVAEFLEEFLCRLEWQLSKGLDFDAEYRYLIDFQRHVTQASVEKPAVEGRASVLKQEFERWQKEGAIGGDSKYKGDPGEECREAKK